MPEEFRPDEEILSPRQRQENRLYQILGEAGGVMSFGEAAEDLADDQCIRKLEAVVVIFDAPDVDVDMLHAKVSLVEPDQTVV